MKKMLDSCTDKREFYAIRRKDFPHDWLDEFKSPIRHIIIPRHNVAMSTKFAISNKGLDAAEKFAQDNNGEVVRVALIITKRFYYPPKRRSVK